MAAKSDSLYVSNLSYSTTDDGLAAAFAGCVKAKVIIDPNTGRSKGFGFVQFESYEAADSMIESTNGQVSIDGRDCKVNYANPRGEGGDRRGGRGGSSRGFGGGRGSSSGYSGGRSSYGSRDGGSSYGSRGDGGYSRDGGSGYGGRDGGSSGGGGYGGYRKNNGGSGSGSYTSTGYGYSSGGRGGY